MKRGSVFIQRNIFWLVLTIPAICFGQTAQQILTETGVTGGLCIHLGCGDGTLTKDLDNNGNRAVHGLAIDTASLQKARAAVKAANKKGFVVIEKATTWNPLPYASNLANLVIADLDQLTSPGLTETEIMRITAPRGVAYLQKNGTWTKTVKPVPAGTDDWTHWDYDATGNAVSKDTLVEPATQIQWMTGYRATMNSPGGQRSYVAPKTKPFGFRSASGRIIFNGAKLTGGKYWQKIVCSDAYNGTVLWEKYLDSDAAKTELAIAMPNRIYTTLGIQYKADPGYLVGLDPATGKVAITYDKGINFKSFGNLNTIMRSVAVSGDYVLQVDTNVVCVLSASTGALLWKKDLPDYVAFPTIAPDKQLVYMVTCTDRRLRTGRNQAVGGVKQVICYDLSNGTEKWRWNFPSTLSPAITQLVYDNGSLLVFGGDDLVYKVIGSTRTPILARIDAVSGTQIFAGTYNCPSQQSTYGGLPQPSLSTSCETVYFRDSTIFEALNWRYHAYDINTGRETGMLEAGWKRSGTWPGYGCEYQRATSKYHLISGGYVAKNNLVNRQFISRSNCATGFFPANGMAYIDDAGCNCFGMLRGQVAVSSEPVLAPIADSLRLDRTYPSAATGGVTFAALPGGPIAEGWRSNLYEYTLGKAETTVVAGSDQVRFDIHRHTVTFIRNGIDQWNFTAGARFCTQIVNDGSSIYLGSHDGWVYALDAQTGTCKWRFMAAPNDQKIVVCSQPVSRWPVMGLSLYNGKIAICAGWHPEIGGGIYIWCIDPSSGKIDWKVRLYSPRIFQPALTAYTLQSNKVLAGEFITKNGQFVINGTSFNNNRDGTPRYFQYAVDPVTWNGQTIDPKTNGVTSVVSPSRADRNVNIEGFIPQVKIANGILTINFGPNAQGRAMTKLHNAAGRTIFAQAIKQETQARFKIDHIAPGNYFISIRTGSRITTCPVLIQ